jgi:hypothetical protein
MSRIILSPGQHFIAADQGNRFTGALFAHLASSTAQENLAKYAVHLANRHREELGFIPNSTYLPALQRGRAVFAVHDGEPIGFLLLGVRSRVLRIHQTVIEQPCRRLLHATRLVASTLALPGCEAVKEIRLRVAADLEANHFWKSIGCEHVGTDVGGTKRGRKILHWRLQTKDRLRLAIRLLHAVLNSHQMGIDTTSYGES